MLEACAAILHGTASQPSILKVRACAFERSGQRLEGLEHLPSIQGLPSNMPHGMVDTPHGAAACSCRHMVQHCYQLWALTEGSSMKTHMLHVRSTVTHVPDAVLVACSL